MKRKTFLKTTALAFLTAFFLISFQLLLALPSPARAEEYEPVIFKPQVQMPIGGSGLNQPSINVASYNKTTGIVTSDLLARYIKALYDYGMMIAGILGAIVLMGGGVLWLVSGGNDSRVSQAKEMIVGSISGLLILFCSWILLNTINPELLKLKAIKTQIIKKIDYFCCEYKDPLILPNGIAAAMMGEDDCKAKNGKLFEPQKNALGQEIKYNVDPNGRKCTTPGCCILRQNHDPKGKILRCTDSYLHACDYGYFQETQCVFVTAEWDANGKISSCKGVTDLCKGEDVEPGDDCFEDNNGDSACYDGTCWQGEGTEGEPCGNELYSKCDKDLEENGQTCSGDLGGRDCASGLWCCKFNSNGTRINK